jgi:hypothetical protein
VTTVRELSMTRPSALATACAPAFVAPAAQGQALGLPAVSTPTWLPTLAFNPEKLHATSLTISKINNYIGSGPATSITQDQKVSAQRVQTVQADMVKGGDARGIPPRGTPV